MSSERPAWLWDGERARIVWANAEGVRWFGGETLFDLIDQPFDAEGEALGRIRALAQELPQGETARETLRLPSAAGETATRCCCSVHALADGRPGLLVVVEDGGADRCRRGLPATCSWPCRSASCSPAARATSALPTRRPATSSRPSGWRGLPDSSSDADQAGKLLARAAAMRIASAVVAMPTRYGRREVRVTAKLLAPAQSAGAPILVLLDDVTDRRTLERALSGPGPKPEAAAPPVGPARPGPAIASAIPTGAPSRRWPRRSSRGLNRLRPNRSTPGRPKPARGPAPEPAGPAAEAEEAETAAAEPQAPAAVPPAAAPAERAPEVPGLVSRALDAVPQAVVLHRQAEILFANRAAVEALGFADRAD
jgi:PAS domain-containing protein